MSKLLAKIRPGTRTYGTLNPVISRYPNATDKFSRLIGSKDNRFHVYLLGSRDPYLNLSIEHYVYEKSAPESTFLFLYINDPCVVIGRNQNPWLEADLRTIKEHNIPIIRRRSGGGTVFHDHGNVNFSVIYPPSEFTRDKYSELVTRALRPYQPRTRVNERHDIVIDQGERLAPALRPAENDMHQSGYEPLQPRKCSGSAYKLSRTRALHHGTCLINSQNLHSIGELLRSPLQPFVKARGVDSVRSPVMNAFPSDQQNAIGLFVDSVVNTFGHKHSLSLPALSFPTGVECSTEFDESHLGFACGHLGSDLKQVEQIRTGMEELKSDSWLWTQTPRFTFSTTSTEDDPRERPRLSAELPSTTRVQFTSRSAQILSADISGSPTAVVDSDNLINRRIDQFESWKDVLALQSECKQGSDSANEQIGQIAFWLDQLFGKKK